MKRNILNIIILVFFIYLLISVFLNKELVYTSFNTGIDIWLNILAPSLFPMFIISEILINYDICKYIGYLFKIIKINPNIIMVIILSMLGGFPSSARFIKILYENKKIDSKSASLLLCCTHFSNPLFILGAVTSFLKGNMTLSIIILLSHYIPNFIILYFVSEKITIKNPIDTNNNSFSKILMTSIKNALSSLLMILGTISFFLILTNLIINNINLNIRGTLLIKGILEVTSSLEYLSMLSLSSLSKVIIISSFLSFGGLCIHAQIISTLEDTDISYTPFLISRIIHALLSIILSIIIYLIYFSLFT